MGTTDKGYPFPEGTDLVVDGDDAIEALAKKIDATVPYGQAAGSVTINSVPANSGRSKTVTMPAGRFSTAPFFTLAVNTGSPNSRSCGFLAPSAASVNIYLGNSGNSTTNGNVHWHAEQWGASGGSFLAVAEAIPDTLVTCPTTGCENQGVAIPVNSHPVDDDGEPVDSAGIECGVCGADLTLSAQPIDGGT